MSSKCKKGRVLKADKSPLASKKRFTDEIKIKVVEAWKEGGTYGSIGKSFCLAKSSIQSIIRGYRLRGTIKTPQVSGRPRKRKKIPDEENVIGNEVPEHLNNDEKNCLGSVCGIVSRTGHIKSSTIYYLNCNKDANHGNVTIKSKTSEDFLINRLFLVSFSPLLKALLLDDEDYDGFGTKIITDVSSDELKTVIKFCAEGILPVPIEVLEDEIPSELNRLFASFGIDLHQVLFGLQETVKAEPSWELNPEEYESEYFTAKVEPRVDIETELSESDIDSHPHSRLVSLYEKCIEARDKYKDYLNVNVPNIKDPDISTFDDSAQSIQDYWRPPKPLSRRTELGKSDESLKIPCKNCPEKFMRENQLRVHEIMFHNSHFQCPYCPNVYIKDEHTKFKSHLFYHEKVSKTNIPHECIQCGEKDFDLDQMMRHIDNFHGPFHNNRCTQCTDTFGTHSDYKHHVDKMHSGKWKYRCDDCERVFDSIQESKVHRVAEHLRNKDSPKLPSDIMCDLCGKVLKGPGGLFTHMRRVHRPSSSPMEHCAKCGKMVKDLNRHMAATHDKLPCDLCGKLIAKARVSFHKAQYHTAPEERKYRCEVCSKGFTTKQRWRDHTNIHTGAKPYTCQYCGKGFANFSCCRLHLRFKHLGEKPKS